MICRGFLLAIAVGGCVESGLDYCADGSVCGPGRVCVTVAPTAGAPNPNVCVTPDQVDQCRDKAELEPCESGHCFSGVCFADECGNGRQDPAEQCDDGNVDASDGCSADCRSNETCRNGETDLSEAEQCDDGNAVAHDGCSNTCQLESREWRQLRPKSLPRSEANMVYDSYRNRIVLFGANTWEWDGVGWMLASPIISPPTRSSFGMAYDAKRRRTVMFGGRNPTLFSDTWEWDGVTWQFVNPATRPPPRAHPAMAYDPIRGRVVMFGGNDAARLSETVDPLGDLWEWDGTNWVELTSTTGPGARAGATMTYDAKRGVLVMFGGVDASETVLDETWELSITGWTQRAPSNRPPPRVRATSTFDAVGGVVLLHGGDDRSVVTFGDTWEWNGADWTRRLPDEASGLEPAMAAFPREGYVVRIDTAGATRVWEAGAWSIRVVASSGAPVARAGHAGAADIDGRRILIHGGGSPPNNLLLGDTWLWDGSVWRQITTPGPPARFNAAMTYDRARGEFVLFGGEDLNAPAVRTNDTWVFDGVQWTQRSPATVPTIRANHVMVYDPAREKIVMFGGSFNPGVTKDARTWEWNGIDWTPHTIAGPPVFEDAMAAYDPIASEVVLFGGRDGATNSSLTWAYNGSWSEKNVVAGPTPRVRGAMAWNAAHRALTLFGGDVGGVIDDVWEWKGGAWTFVPVAGLGARESHTLFPSLDGRGVLAFAGNQNLTTTPVDTFAELVSRSSSLDETCGSADVDLDGLVACEDPDCWPTCRPAQPPDAAMISTAPRCDDLVCDRPRESCDHCPSDCGPCPVRCGDGLVGAGEDRTTCPGDFCIAADCQ